MTTATTTRFRVEFDTTNSAFDETEMPTALAEVLRRVADRLEPSTATI